MALDSPGRTRRSMAGGGLVFWNGAGVGAQDRHEVSGINGEPIKHEVTKFEQAAQKIYGDNEE